MKKIIGIIYLLIILCMATNIYSQPRGAERFKRKGVAHFKKAFLKAILEKEQGKAAGEYALAEKAFQEAIQRKPEWVEPYLRLGRTYFVQKKYSDAARIYHKAILLSPWRRDIKLKLTTARKMAERYKGFARVPEKLFLHERDNTSSDILQKLPIASNPNNACYDKNGRRIFWFMIISDSHIGTRGTQAADYLTWIVNDAKEVIDPLFILNTGDLTNSTNGRFIPRGPYQEEWDIYREILDNADIDASFYYDIPGNHDAYNDADFSYYLSNSIQGSISGSTQHSWIREFPFGTYHFIGICTPGNDGAPFSFRPRDNFGDHAGLDEIELAFIKSQLINHTDSELTFIFGHHPFDAHYSAWLDTGLTYGSESLLNLIDDYNISQYGFGHTHDYRESFYYDDLPPGVFYLNLASLGKSDQNHYAIMAIDGNGLSVTPADKGVWPVVLITAPLNQWPENQLNPFTYDVPQSSQNPVRALVFDANPVIKVEFRVDKNGDWQEMEQVEDTPAWQGVWDASNSTPGPHTIEVQAYGSTMATDHIETFIDPELPVENFNDMDS